MSDQTPAPLDLDAIEALTENVMMSHSETRWIAYDGENATIPHPEEVALLIAAARRGEAAEARAAKMNAALELISTYDKGVLDDCGNEILGRSLVHPVIRFIARDAAGATEEGTNE